jgi:hypothetical protein
MRTRLLVCVLRTFGILNCATLRVSNIVLLHSPNLSAYEDGTERSETSAYKIQTPGNYPEESTQHSEHGESLKSRIHVKNLNFAELSVNISSRTGGDSYFDSFAISATWWLNPKVHTELLPFLTRYI